MQPVFVLGTIRLYDYWLLVFWCSLLLHWVLSVYMVAVQLYFDLFWLSRGAFRKIFMQGYFFWNFWLRLGFLLVIPIDFLYLLRLQAYAIIFLLTCLVCWAYADVFSFTYLFAVFIQVLFLHSLRSMGYTGVLLALISGDRVVQVLSFYASIDTSYTCLITSMWYKLGCVFHRVETFSGLNSAYLSMLGLYNCLLTLKLFVCSLSLLFNFLMLHVDSTCYY